MRLNKISKEKVMRTFGKLIAPLMIALTPYIGFADIVPGASGLPASAPSGMTLPTSGGTASTLNYYEEYSATISTNAESAFLSSGSITNLSLKLVKVGSLVTMNLSAGSGTAGNAAPYFSFAAAIPARFRPSIDTSMAAFIRDNGASLTTSGLVYIVASSGDIRFYKDATGTNNFTNGTSIGLASQRVSVSWTTL